MKGGTAIKLFIEEMPRFTFGSTELSECSARLAGLRRIAFSCVGIMAGICCGEGYGLGAGRPEVLPLRRRIFPLSLSAFRRKCSHCSKRRRIGAIRKFHGNRELKT